jgi:hypothetical protein
MIRLIETAMFGVVLVACARPPRAPTTVEAAAASPHPEQVSREAPATAPVGEHGDGPVGEHGDGPVADSADTASPRTEQAELEGPGGLRVVVRWQTMTGQHHSASEIVITAPGGVLRLVQPQPDESGEGVDPGDYPLIERILGAGPGRWVMLGWSSFGEGLQTEHAWLIEDWRGPRVVDSLGWTTDRGHAGFAVEAVADQVRIGIPLPQPPAPRGPDDDHDGSSLHSPGSWLLAHGKQQLDLDEVEKLPASETHVMALRGYYNPPYQDEPSRRHWSGRFVWFLLGQN